MFKDLPETLHLGTQGQTSINTLNNNNSKFAQITLFFVAQFLDLKIKTLISEFAGMFM